MRKVDGEFWSYMDGVGCDADTVDANVDTPESETWAGRTGGGMDIASSNYHSCSLSRSRWRLVSF